MQDLNIKMAEYTKAVVSGRPAFHINLVIDVSPYCDCHAENDMPILPDVGMFASFDPVPWIRHARTHAMRSSRYGGVFWMNRFIRKISATTMIIL